MPNALDHAAALGRARMLLAMLAVPKLRRGLAELLAGAEMPEDPGVAGPLSRLDWIDEGGEVDVAAVREAADSLAMMRSDRAILEVDRLESIPVKTEESREVSGRIARIVFERLGSSRTLDEAELNAAIAMFAQDVALVRRDAVDSGVLTRSADGSAYRLTSPGSSGSPAPPAG